MEKAKKIVLIWIIAFVICLDVASISFTTDLLTKANDLAVAFGLLIIGALLTCNYLFFKPIINQFKTKKTMKKLFLIMAIAIGLQSCSERIDAGHEGILVNDYGTDKGVQDVTLATGRVFYNPFTQSVYETPLFVQTIDYAPFSVNAKDGSVFVVDPTLSFMVQGTKSPFIFKKYRKKIAEIAETAMYNYVKDAFRLQMNKYTTDELISNREKFENEVQKTLSDALKLDFFELQQLTSGLQYPETIVKAIDAKNKAVQQAMQVENEVKIADAKAKITIVNATTKANALKIQADAEAYANKARQSSLNPLLVQQQFVEEWNGVLPVYGQVPSLFKDITK